jgi:transposase
VFDHLYSCAYIMVLKGALSAALVTPWTTSPVEGQISRLKMLKRTLYGRSGFELLRARVLNPT